MKKLAAIIVAVILTACSSAPPKQLIVTETKFAPLENKHFEIPEAPKPSLNREEAKKLNDKDKITWLTGLYLDALGHIQVLENQILGIKKASDEAARKLNAKKE